MRVIGLSKKLVGPNILAQKKMNVLQQVGLKDAYEIKRKRGGGINGISCWRYLCVEEKDGT